jgi:hypothetical protein
MQLQGRLPLSNRILRAGAEKEKLTQPGHGWYPELFRTFSRIACDALAAPKRVASSAAKWNQSRCATDHLSLR